MRIYFILTAALIFAALTVPLAINEIGKKLTTTEISVSLTQTTESTVSDKTPEKETVKVQRTSSGAVDEVTMIDYIVGTVAGEMPASFSVEALKAQAVASYTYARYIKENSNRNDILISDSSFIHQSYIDKTEQEEKWGEHYDEYRGKIESTVKSVLGEYITFGGKTAMTVFHALSADKTNSAEEIWGEAVPYLISVNAPSDEESKNDCRFAEKEFRKLFEENGEATFDGDDPRKWAKVLKKSDTGYIRSLAVADKTFSAVEIAEILSLPSANFTAKYSDDAFIFTAHGKGHGVGMCQYAAEHLASEGKSYTEILAHFYPGTTLVKE